MLKHKDTGATGIDWIVGASPASRQGEPRR